MTEMWKKLTTQYFTEEIEEFGEEINSACPTLAALYLFDVN